MIPRTCKNTGHGVRLGDGITNHHSSLMGKLQDSVSKEVESLGEGDTHEIVCQLPHAHTHKKKKTIVTFFSC